MTASMSYEDAMFLIKRKGICNYYEQQHDIFSTGNVRCILKDIDIEVWAVEKSDKTETMKILFRTRRNADSWLIWDINDSQMDVMIHQLPRIYYDFNTRNANKRNGPIPQDKKDREGMENASA